MSFWSGSIIYDAIFTVMLLPAFTYSLLFQLPDDFGDRFCVVTVNVSEVDLAPSDAVTFIFAGLGRGLV